MSKIHTF